MYLIRPADAVDLPQIAQLASATVAGGLTSLPEDAQLLAHKVERSAAAFADATTAEEDHTYLFVLTDGTTIGGVSSIRSRVGKRYPIPFYRIEERHWGDTLIAGGTEQRLLVPATHDHGPSEMCTLFLAPDYRHSGLGKLLSWCRFLFMANHPQLFAEQTIAMLRGIIDEEGNSLFWEHVGRHFFHIDYSTLIAHIQQDPAVAIDVITEFPLYLSLLPPPAQAAIGKPHPHSAAALALLQEQGFSLINGVDPFDAGPQLLTTTAAIGAIRDSSATSVATIATPKNRTPQLIANTRREQFRATLAPFDIQADGSITLAPATAEQLQLGSGDPVRIV